MPRPTRNTPSPLPPRVEWNRRLLRWYDREKRAMPWRATPDPYRVWVSEIMLQQTQVETVIPYFNRFVEAFPDVRALAKAPSDRVMKLWEGLGYYSRARNLQKAAQVIIALHGGQVPGTIEDLMALPGVGRYTAGAIASIAFGVVAPLVDGNVARVLSRVTAMPLLAKSKEGQQRLWATAAALVSPRRPGDSNQALMELGARVCLPRTPRCGACPVSALCAGYQKGAPTDYPVTEKRKPVPTIIVTAGVIWSRDGRRILISQRPDEGLLGGLWEFPGGKLEPGETLETCLQREIMEELGIAIRVGSKLMEVRHAYTHRLVHLHIFHAHHESGRPKALEVARWQWVPPSGLREKAFPAANVKIIEEIEKNPAPPEILGRNSLARSKSVKMAR